MGNSARLPAAWITDFPPPHAYNFPFFLSPFKFDIEGPMKRLHHVFLLVSVVASLLAVGQQPKTAGTASKPAAATEARQAPPIIDRELFFGNPEIAGAQLSPNGKYITFLKPWKDTRNIWIKGINEPFSAARLL